jgi:hypothetical protein
MHVSAECRWFTRSNPTGLILRNWFFDSAEHSYSLGEGVHRQDGYLLDPEQPELGIKRRGSQVGVEIKGLVFLADAPVECGTLAAKVEIWSKWTSARLDLSPFETITISKTRWVRTFNTSNAEPTEIEANGDEDRQTPRIMPVQGCNVEFTEIDAFGVSWFSLGVEAFGSFAEVDASVRRTTTVLASRRIPRLPDMFAASYPQWITKIMREGRR